MLGRLKRYLNNQFERDKFVISELSKLPAEAKLLDAGAGSQRYRRYCSHLDYFAQDFGRYKHDEKPSFTDGLGCFQDGQQGYDYGPIDYIGHIWGIQEEDQHFDAILCTEVLEHIPYPIDTIKELSRLLKPGGTLILTAPSNCLRHMDPYYYYSGFSDRFYETILRQHGFEIESIQPVGDYYKWICVELARSAASHSLLAKLLLATAFLYFLVKKPTQSSINTLCMGYHIVAHKMIH
jgi:SAM-dependent methyltransferase